MELLVDMDCQGCETKVRRAISKLDGKKKNTNPNMDLLHIMLVLHNANLMNMCRSGYGRDRRGSTKGDGHRVHW